MIDQHSNDDWFTAVLLAGRVTARDVVELRNDCFPMGLVTLADAEALFRVERTILDKHASWSAAFSQLLTDFLIWGERPTGKLSPDRAEWALVNVGKTRSAAAEMMLTALVGEAHTAPAWFAAAVERRTNHAVGFNALSAAPAFKRQAA